MRRGRRGDGDEETRRRAKVRARVGGVRSVDRGVVWWGVGGWDGPDGGVGRVDASSDGRGDDETTRRREERSVSIGGGGERGETGGWISMEKVWE